MAIFRRKLSRYGTSHLGQLDLPSLWKWPTEIWHIMTQLGVCSLSPFNGHFPGEPRLTGVIEAEDDRGGGDNWTTGAISHAKLQSNHHHQQTNIQFFFTGQMPFLSPNQQCQSTEGKISQSMYLLTPSSPGGLPTSSLTTNSSWLPWERVAMPLIMYAHCRLKTTQTEMITATSCDGPLRGSSVILLLL